ncbi:MAG: hypothetical protein ACPG9O_05400 [Candidatus Poseidoniaceae archaeon]
MPGTTRVEIRTLKVGRYCCVEDKAYKINSISKSKPGKHGSAKVICKGKDILTGKQYECTFHSGDMVDAPITKRDEYTLLNIEE